jgi:Tol biopolymer transport system component
MSLSRGARLGVYEVQYLLGAGGMGEVYGARDTRLNRDVAIKVLPEAFTLDTERLARFGREAQLLASLNHPNIAAIYGLEEWAAASDSDAAPRQALVLEFVDGQTLAERIAHGPLTLDEALAVAKQITEALEFAHVHGIVHRDLKPANIKLRSDGRVKVLDFGLAKLVSPRDGSQTASGTSSGGPSLSDVATMASPIVTGANVIIGSAAYMSPEQVRGLPADRRSDVWALGCLVFEMLTGTRAFQAEDVSGTVAAVLERQPAWERLPPSTPPAIRRLLRRCLEKNPQRRIHDVSDARLEIEEALAAPSIDERPVVSGSRFGAPVVVAIVAACAATAALVWFLKPAPAGSGTSANGVARFLIAPSEPISENEGVLVISRDGRRVAYAAGQPGRQRLFVREIDQFTSRAIPDTDGVMSAAFSPDGQMIAFLAERKLRTVAIAGGMPLTLRDRVDGAGLAWTTDEGILFNPGTSTGIWRIAVGGGEPVALTQPGLKDNEQRFPELLPNGKGILFCARGGVTTDKVYVESLQTHQRRLVVEGSAPHYLPTGHLVFVQAGTLFAVRFDIDRLEATGAPVTLLEGISQARSGQPLISYSDTGAMVYLPTVGDASAQALVWVDSSGNEQPAGASGRPWAQPRVSPDGRRAVTSLRSGTEDLWLVDLERGTVSRLTADSSTSFPVWMPDGRRLIFASAREGTYSAYRRPVDGSAPDEKIMSADWPIYTFSATGDGNLAIVSVSPKTLQDIRVMNVDRKGESTPFLETPFREGGPAFSPDGKWIAYVSDESGRFEIYVRPYPGPGEKWPISTGGGNEPVWRRDGRQLFYRVGDAMMAVDIQTSPAFSAGKPRTLFDKPYERSNALWANYDAAPDNRHLLMVRRETPSAPVTRINVVLNWVDDLKQKLPIP